MPFAWVLFLAAMLGTTESTGNKSGWELADEDSEMMEDDVKDMNTRQDSADLAANALVSENHHQLTERSVRNGVGFTVHMSKQPVTVSPRSPFVYDVVTTNIGNAYNSNSGVFTAPVTGIYVFHFQLMNHAHTSTIHAGIFKGASALCVTTGEGGWNSYDKGSCLAVTQVQKGEHVFVRHFNNDLQIEGGPWNSFAGFLLQKIKE